MLQEKMLRAKEHGSDVQKLAHMLEESTKEDPDLFMNILREEFTWKEMSSYISKKAAERRKQTTGSPNCLCVDSETVLGWAIEFFMLDELPKPPVPAVPAPTKKPDPKAKPKSKVCPPTKPAPELDPICENPDPTPVKKKKEELQCSIFDLLNEPGPEARPAADVKVIEKSISSARSDGYAEDDDESVYDSVIAELEEEEIMQM